MSDAYLSNQEIQTDSSVEELEKKAYALMFRRGFRLYEPNEKMDIQEYEHRAGADNRQYNREFSKGHIAIATIPFSLAAIATASPSSLALIEGHLYLFLVISLAYLFFSCICVFLYFMGLHRQLYVKYINAIAAFDEENKRGIAPEDAMSLFREIVFTYGSAANQEYLAATIMSTARRVTVFDGDAAYYRCVIDRMTAPAPGQALGRVLYAAEHNIGKFIFTTTWRWTLYGAGAGALCGWLLRQLLLYFH